MLLCVCALDFETCTRQMFWSLAKLETKKTERGRERNRTHSWIIRKGDWVDCCQSCLKFSWREREKKNYTQEVRRHDFVELTL